MSQPQAAREVVLLYQTLCSLVEKCFILLSDNCADEPEEACSRWDSGFVPNSTCMNKSVCLSSNLVENTQHTHTQPSHVDATYTAWYPHWWDVLRVNSDSWFCGKSQFRTSVHFLALWTAALRYNPLHPDFKHLQSRSETRGDWLKKAQSNKS